MAIGSALFGFGGEIEARVLNSSGAAQ